jgi:heptosyltransferase II
MRILLVQTSFLGDTILSTPVIAGIKRLFPKAELWMMTTPLSADLVRRDPLLNGVITFDKRKRRAGVLGLIKASRELKLMQFDRAYSLHRSYRTSLLLWMARIPLRIGCADAKGRLFYHRLEKRDFRQHDVIRNMSILAGDAVLDPDAMHMRLFAPSLDEIGIRVRDAVPPSGSYAVLVPGSAWRTKMWNWEGFRQVAEFLVGIGYGVVLLGAGSDRTICAQVAQNLPLVDLSGNTGIADAMHVIKHARLVVCNDSMSLHMASAFQVPTVAIFCATSVDFGYGPWKNRAIVVEQKNLDCKPCRPHGSVKCPNGTEACMRGPNAGEVIGAIRSLIEIGDEL